jgi:triosephosphate isomerase
MLRGIGVERVLVGHSERRHVFGEKDEWMGRKVRAALDKDLLPVLCIGETLEERNGGQMDSVIERQLSTGLDWVKQEEISRVTLAYEPVWAIGTGVTATPEQAQEAHVFVRAWIEKKFGDEAAGKIRILYGGSVKPDNVKELMANPDVDGVLVGGASLSADLFLPIIEFDK